MSGTNINSPSVLAITPLFIEAHYCTSVFTSCWSLRSSSAALATPSLLTLPFGIPWIGAHFRLDPLAAFFLIVVGLGSAGASLYALGYARHEHEPQPSGDLQQAARTSRPRCRYPRTRPARSSHEPQRTRGAPSVAAGTSDLWSRPARICLLSLA